MDHLLHPRSGRIVLEPTNQPFEEQAVLNPATIQLDKTTHLFYRAVDKQNTSRISHSKFEHDKLLSRDTQPILEPEFDTNAKA